MPMQDNTLYKKLVEAALFMSPRALSAEEIAKAIGVGAIGAIEDYVDELIKDYSSRDTALEISKIGGKFMLTIKEEYANKVSGLAAGPDLSRGALRLLAYISKNNGIMQSELVKAFGETTYDYMKELTEKEFVETKKQGRSKKVTLTSKFFEYFNIAEGGTAYMYKEQEQNDKNQSQTSQA